MRHIILALAAILTFGAAMAAYADDFNGQAESQATAATVQQRAADANMADPTSPSSLRSHGRP